MTYSPEIGSPWPFKSRRGLTGTAIPPTWHALITAPQREKRTSDLLSGAGVDVRYPTIEYARHINGKKRKVTRPMITQIIYAKFSYAPQWDVMRDRRVITGVFARGGEPIALTDDDVAKVMGLPTEAERIEAERIEAERPRPGEKAEILDGPFSGFFVEVDRVEFGRVWWSYLGAMSFKGESQESEIRRVAR